MLTEECCPSPADRPSRGGPAPLIPRATFAVRVRHISVIPAFRAIVVLALALVACTAPELGVSPTPASTAATARPTAALTRVVRFGVPGLDDSPTFLPSLIADVPSAWAADLDGRIVNWAMWQLIAVGNGDLHGLATVPGNGDVDPLQLPRDRVIVQVQYQCRFVCRGPAEETPFPLDWSAAAPASAEREATLAAAGVHERTVGLRYFDTPLLVVGRWGDAAPPADIAAIARIVASIRPDPPAPGSGEFRGWANAGRLVDLPIGTVRLTPLPDGAVIRPPYRIFDNAPFFLVRGAKNIYAFSSRPLVDQRCEAAYDPSDDQFHCSIEGQRSSWTRFGHYLGPDPNSEMSQHRVIIRDGAVWVHYLDASRLFPAVPDEAAER